MIADRRVVRLGDLPASVSAAIEAMVAAEAEAQALDAKRPAAPDRQPDEGGTSYRPEALIGLARHARP